MDEMEAKRIVEAYSDMILRVSYTYLKNTDDAEDICQDVFLKMLTGKSKFDSLEHEKAWVIRVTINRCKDILKSAQRQKEVGIEVMPEVVQVEAVESDVLDMVMQLPEAYREVIYLHTYEGYSAKEIADIVGKSETAVMALLSRGRKKLKENFLKRGEYDGQNMGRGI